MDWRRFLEENNIHFVDRGPNTKRGEVSIKCPMCAEDDPSEHLGINLTNGKWGCHRDSNHRGKASRTLIKALLGCSNQQAQIIIKQYSHSDPDTLEAALAVLEIDNNTFVQHDEDIARLARHQKLGPQFNDFYRIKSRGITKRFFQYLMERGYENPQDIIEAYDLRCAMTGRYKDRIIIPIKLNDELLGWTSRALGKPINAPRYLASSEDVKTTVFNYDDLRQGGKRLFIVEGPFDAIKLDSFRITTKTEVDYRATCVFGTSFTVSQIALLRALVKSYDESYVLFDKGADGPADDLATWLGIRRARLPEFYDDPGEMEFRHLYRLGEKDFNGWLSSGLDHLSNSFSKGITGIATNTNPFWRTYKR